MVSEILKEKQLDGIVITSRVNRIYLSGFTGTEGMLLLTPEKNYIFVDGRYTIQARQQAKGFEVVEFKSEPYSLLSEYGLNRIGFENNSILHRVYSKLPDCEKVGVSKDIDILRMIKTEEELKKMQTAADIADAAFEHILNYIRPGITEMEIANELEFFMKRNGASGLSFDTIVAVGERSALPHAFPDKNEVRKGEVVLMDYGCVYEGYCSDMTRTVAVGNISDKMKEIYDIVLKAQESAEQSIKAGITGIDADKVARDIIEKAGYGKNFSHSLGHGVGLEIHEAPNLSPKSPLFLPKNTVVTVEPGIYVEGLGGVRIEDMGYVTKDGFISFTKSPKDLIIL